MKCAILRESLLKPLQAMINIVEKKQNMPVLSNLLLTVKDNLLTLTSTDLELELICTIPLLLGEEGAITTPARKLYDIVRSLPEKAELELVLMDSKLILQSGRSRFSLATLPAENFPTMESQLGQISLKMPQKTLLSLIEHTYFAMAQQDVRYFLNGMLLELSDKILRMVATDGHRLAMSTEHIKEGHTGTTQVLIPRKAVLELMRLLEDKETEVTLIFGTHYLRLVSGDISLTTKLLDGRYPDYQRVIPAPGKHVLLAQKEQLKQALSLTAILSNEKFRGIRLGLGPNLLKLEANNPEQEEARNELEVAYVGDAIEIGFNVNYILDVLNVIDSNEVKLAFINATSSVLIQDPAHTQHLYVVMPIRL